MVGGGRVLMKLFKGQWTYHQLENCQISLIYALLGRQAFFVVGTSQDS